MTTDPNERPVHGTLTYNNDVSKAFDPLKPYGPSTVNEMYWFLNAEYDSETNKTKVHFTQVPPDEFFTQLGAEVPR